MMTILGDQNFAEFNNDFACALADAEDQTIGVLADAEDQVICDSVVTEVKLERLRVGVLAGISPHLLGAGVDVAIDYIVGGVEARIRGYWWSESLGKTKFEYPRDWWQAFKARWFPAWALRRWPVENECHNLDMKVLYPDFRPSLPDQSYNFAIIREFSERQGE